MRVVSATEMVRTEGCAYAEGAVDRDFMESAGLGVAKAVQQLTSDWSIAWHAILLCGSGNNAGDAYVAGCHLLEMGYKVEAMQLSSVDRCSRLCKESLDRFIEEGGIVQFIESADEIELPESGFLIDAMLGTGFHGEVKGLFADVIDQVNGLRLPIFSIDIPSGVSGDHGLVSDGKAIVAVATLYLGLPKRGFFLGKAWECVGHLVGVDFGIDSKFLDDAQADLEMMTEERACHLLPRVARTRHKYDAGAITAFAGSPSMPGAAILSCLAALRAGAGLIKLLIQEGHAPHLPPEIIRLPEDASAPFEKAKAALMGPGIGLDAEKRAEKFLSACNLPTVLDADMLTLIARHPEWKLPKEAVLTPHFGEFCRLIGREGAHLEAEERIELCRDYSEKIGQTVVLKGAPTIVFHPRRRPVVSPAGDPAMATAGSGDVLTGIIAALLAQGLPTWKAAELGVYLHGLAGELAAERRTVYGVIASDLIEELPAAFKRLAAARTLGRGVVTPTPGFANIPPPN